MKTFADIKRKLTLGRTLTMTRHDWFPNGELINLPRRINTVQTNAIQFEPHKEGSKGSWLHFKTAKEYRVIDDNTFQVALTEDFSKVMEYKIS